MGDQLDEFNGVANLAATVKGAGHMASLARHRDDPTSDRHKNRAKKKKKSKRNEAFEDLVTQDLLETVKKKGGVWKLYDDKTKAEVGSYKDRKAAWAAQRIKRMQAKSNKAYAKRRKKQSATSHLNKKGKKVATRESLEGSIARVLLEANPYVFEQSPTSQDAAGWDAFVSRMSHEVMQSDPRLKNMLVALHNTRIKVLQSAYSEISNVLTKTKSFELGKPKIKVHGADNEPVLLFEIVILEAKKKVSIGITIQHDKPVFLIPEQTKTTLNSMATKESKLLRAELMHTQETIFDHMTDIAKASEKRNSYLRNMESKIDKMVTSMNPVQIALLRNLIKTKFANFK